MRFYGFEAAEIAPLSGMPDLEVDPKLAWALANRGVFPVEVNKAVKELLLRVPGFGTRPAQRTGEMAGDFPDAQPLVSKAPALAVGAAIGGLALDAGVGQNPSLKI